MTDDHRRRTDLLDTLAVMSGFEARLVNFTDGRLPDVLRLALPTKGLFVGDAKATERPGCTSTYLRLRRYAVWVEHHLHRPDSHAVIALAVPAADAANWAVELQRLADDVALPLGDVTHARIDALDSVAWIVLSQASLVGRSLPSWLLSATS